MKFGARLRALRERKHISQRALAAQIGISQSYLNKIEQSVSPPPSERHIRLIAQALDINATDLILHAGQMPESLKTMLDNKYATRLVRVLSEQPLPDIVYKDMLYLARKAQEEQSA